MSDPFEGTPWSDEPDPQQVEIDKLKAALRKIRDCHLGDCPAGQDELSHARGHVFTLREMAMHALKD